jgi:hypothetical protein
MKNTKQKVSAKHIYSQKLEVTCICLIESVVGIHHNTTCVGKGF